MSYTFLGSVGGGCSLLCGGSVIDTNWVVTAGHCVYGNTGRPGNFAVKAGVFDESSSTETGEMVINVASIHLHPNYVPNPVPHHDIALIEVESM
jgi:secreted trypsin-like serine protease